MARKSKPTVADTIESSVESTVEGIVAQQWAPIVVGRPLVNIEDDRELFTDRQPGRYELHYTTYGSLHRVLVHWDGTVVSTL